ncbi:hypothetical protein D0Y60_01850 [Shinella sp. WSJ-2]|uniref:hypothetical protein n=1 Tax=Shinella sp. WSJ-2 TaxID=2303749 RepID=UPI000E3B6D01|nr:hypothetical protein [Shinella sp. WSJ-2]RFZ89396.1 hypothetical protein D0Y60_01850 [Shinella sp. WSJ-2]
MAGELVERNTLIAILCRLTTKPGRDHRSGQEFVVAGSSQETVDALRQAAVILRRDNSRIEALERANATLRAERGEARKALEHAREFVQAYDTPAMNPDQDRCLAQIDAAIRNMGGEG